jgi:hypothetical protein
VRKADNLPPSCAVVTKSGNLNFLRTLWACNGNVLPFYQRRAEGSDPFLRAKGVPGAEMHRMMSVQYGGSVMLRRIGCEWIKIKNGRTRVKHGERTGHQSTSITDADMERAYGMILQNRRVTVEVAHQLQFSRGSTYESIHNRHAFHEVPKYLTELHKEKHLDICKRLLNCNGAEGDHFLERIVI